MEPIGIAAAADDDDGEDGSMHVEYNNKHWISSTFHQCLTQYSRSAAATFRSQPPPSDLTRLRHRWKWTPKLKYQKSSAVDEMAAQCCVCHFLLLNNTNITHFLLFPSYSAVVVKLSVIQWRVPLFNALGMSPLKTYCQKLDSFDPKAVKFGEITRNNGQLALQGHSRSPLSVPGLYATILLVNNSNSYPILHGAPFPWYRGIIRPVFAVVRRCLNALVRSEPLNSELRNLAIETSLYRTAWQLFGYLEPFTRASLLWLRTDGQTFW